MMQTMTYRNSFFIAVGLHFLIICLLMIEGHTEKFVINASQRSDVVESKMEMNRPEAQPLQAVSVDSQEVAETLDRLKSERALKEQAEINRQNAMQEQLRVAKQQRIREQRHLAQMKKEAAQMAVAQQKKVAAEKQHLRELAEQKIQQEKSLAALKQQQEQLKKQQVLEKQRLTAALQKQKQEEAMQAQRESLAQAQRDSAAQAAQAEARRKAAQQAVLDQQRAAQMSGEVNKYKALIIQAISQHWILPDHVNPQLFSQFRIQLVPSGKVLSVSLIKSSGDPVLDRSAQAAIYKASPLPVPSDQAMFNLFRDISLTVRPESTRG